MELKDHAFEKSNTCQSCPYLKSEKSSFFSPANSECLAGYRECPVVEKAVDQTNNMLCCSNESSNILLSAFIVHLYHPNFIEYSKIDQSDIFKEIRNNSSYFQVSISENTLPVIGEKLEEFLLKRIEYNLV